MESFSKGLILTGMNSTTKSVFLAMIIFLVFLMGGLVFALINSLPKLREKNERKVSQTKSAQIRKPKGF